MYVSSSFNVPTCPSAFTYSSSVFEDFFLIVNTYSTSSSSTGELKTIFIVVSSSGVCAVNDVVPTPFVICSTFTFTLLDVGVTTTFALVASASIQAI